MEQTIIKMANEIARAKKSGKRFGNIDIEFVANTINALRNGNCKITFKKMNGEVVEKIATARESVVKYNVKNPDNRHLIVTPFFDLTELKWKSFRWDRLISCELLK